MTYRASSIASAIVGALLGLPGCGDDGAPPANDDDGGTSSGGPSSSSDDGIEVMCTPGEVRCAGTEALETCAATGRLWLAAECPSNTQCVPCAEDDANCEVDACLGPCDVSVDLPSSAGCSFLANRQLHPYLEDWVDGLVIGNPGREGDGTASVSIFFAKEGSVNEELFAGPFSLEPGQSTSVELTSTFTAGSASFFRTGGVYRVVSDLPVVAYQHSPLAQNRGNDSSLLLPDSILGQDYVVASHSANGYVSVNDSGTSGLPSYFVVIALEDLTTVEWTPPVATSGNGLPIPPVEAGETGTLIMNRLDLLRVATRIEDFDLNDPFTRDVSGTVIHADKPIWVVGASRCSMVPDSFENAFDGTCDPLQEQMIPLSQWGTQYVAPTAPQRGDEWMHWRVFAGKDGVTVTSDPPLPGLPHTFERRGEYIEIDAEYTTGVFFEADGPIMPVGYLQSRILRSAPPPEREPREEYLDQGVAGRADPSMVQMVAVEQYLDRYVFVTGVSFNEDYVVVMRKVGNADVVLDGETVDGFELAGGEFEVATVSIEEGAHVIESDDPFGIIQVGYSSGEAGDPKCGNNMNAEGEPIECNASYAYPGGLKAEQLFIP